MMLTLERLRQVYRYEPETGDFIRLEATNSHRGKAQIGQPGGVRSERYIKVGVDGRQYYAHRLAWLYMTGEWPRRHIDHKNRDGCDNRWSNLRPCDPSLNLANSGLRSDNTSGFKGVTATPFGTFQARIHVRQQKICLGTFPSRQQAAAAYRAAAEKYFGEYHRISVR